MSYIESALDLLTLKSWIPVFCLSVALPPPVHSHHIYSPVPSRPPGSFRLHFVSLISLSDEQLFFIFFFCSSLNHVSHRLNHTLANTVSPHVQRELHQPAQQNHQDSFSQKARLWSSSEENRSSWTGVHMHLWFSTSTGSSQLHSNLFIAPVGAS